MPKPPLKFSSSPKATAKVPASDDVERIFISARIPAPTYRQFKGYAGEQGRKVQDIMEEAITEYLANHRR